MSDFDQNDPKYDKGGGGGGKFKNLQTPGEYIMGIRGVVETKNSDAHGLSENGKRWTRFGIVVIDGPHRGESFLNKIYRSPSSYTRLACWCKAIRYTDRFDPAKTRDMESVFIGRAFKGKVEVENGYASVKWPEIESWTEDEMATMKAWEQDQGERARSNASSGSYSDGGYSDDHSGGGGSDLTPPDFGDEEIPFGLNTVEHGSDPAFYVCDPLRKARL
jgi:hypothetical protein